MVRSILVGKRSTWREREFLDAPARRWNQHGTLPVDRFLLAGYDVNGIGHGQPTESAWQAAWLSHLPFSCSIQAARRELATGSHSPGSRAIDDEWDACGRAGRSDFALLINNRMSQVDGDDWFELGIGTRWSARNRNTQVVQGRRAGLIDRSSNGSSSRRHFCRT